MKQNTPPKIVLFKSWPHLPGFNESMWLIITEFDIINTKNSSTAYVVIYKLIT